MVERNSVSRRNVRTASVTTRWGLGLGLLLTAAVTSATPQPGDIAVKFPINDDDPVSSVPSVADRNADPLEFANHLQDLIARADGAYRKQDYAHAAKYFEALAREVPDRATAFSRLCLIYAKLGRIDVAAANCAKATRLDGSKVHDHLRFIGLTLRKAELSDKDLTEIDASLVHLREYSAAHPQPLPGATKAQNVEKSESGAKPATASAPGSASGAAPTRSKQEILSEILRRKKDEARQGGAAKARATDKLAAEDELPHLATEIETLACQVGSRLRDDTRLTQCIDALQALKAPDKTVLPFAWLQAILQKDSQRAETLLEDARKFGVNEATLKAMQLEQDKAFGGMRYLRWGLWGIGLVAVAAALAALVRFSGRRRKPNLPVEASVG